MQALCINNECPWRGDCKMHDSNWDLPDEDVAVLRYHPETCGMAPPMKLGDRNDD